MKIADIIYFFLVIPFGKTIQVNILHERTTEKRAAK